MSIVMRVLDYLYGPSNMPIIFSTLDYLYMDTKTLQKLNFVTHVFWWHGRLWSTRKSQGSPKAYPSYSAASITYMGTKTLRMLHTYFGEKSTLLTKISNVYHVFWRHGGLWSLRKSQRYPKACPSYSAPPITYIGTKILYKSNIVFTDS